MTHVLSLLNVIAPIKGEPAINWQSVSLILLLCLLAGMYQHGMLNLWRRAGRGRVIRFQHNLTFLAGLFVLMVALVSPIDQWADSLFTAHMIQHILLIFVAAPLIALAHPAYVLLWAVSRSWAKHLAYVSHQQSVIRYIIKQLSQPFVAWLLFILTIWLWHIPLLYEVALRNNLVHEAEHATLFMSALCFWLTIFSPFRHQHGWSTTLLILTTVQGTALGVLFVFSTEPWYAHYLTTTVNWGINPLEDQQIAGVLMWLSGGVLCTVLASLYFVKWFGAVSDVSPKFAYPED